MSDMHTANSRIENSAQVFFLFDEVCPRHGQLFIIFVEVKKGKWKEMMT
jgi:hypothetical protein